MFLKLINIDHFGAWEDSTLDEFELRTTVIYGPNEAGKSTLMEFIRGIFFGWSETERTKYLDDRRELPQGGEIELVDHHENLWSIARTATFEGDDRWRDTVKISRNNVSIEETAAWEQLFQNISEAVFENVFTIGLNELEELAALDQTEAAEFLYDLSAGAERVALSHAAIQVCNQADAIVDNTPSFESIGYCLKEQEKQRTIVSDSMRAVDQWHRLSNRLTTLAEQVDQKKSERESLERRLKDVQIALDAIPLIEERNALYAATTKFRVPGDWDEREANDAIHTLRQIESELSESGKDQLEREATRARLINERDALEISSQILGARHRIQSLEEQSNWIASLTGQITRHEAEVEYLSEELQAFGDSDDGEWLSAGRSLLVALRQPARQLKEARMRLEKSQLGLAKAVDRYESVASELETVKAQHNVSDVDKDIEVTGDRISTIRQRVSLDRRLEELSSRKVIFAEKHEAWTQRQLPSITQLAVLGVSFITGSVFLLTLLFLSNYLSLSGGSRVVCLAIGVTGIAGSLFGKFACRLHAKQELEKYTNKLEIASTQEEQLLSLRQTLDEKLGDARQSLESLLERAEARSKTLATILPLKVRVDSASKDVAENQAMVDSHDMRLREASTTWENALAELGVPTHLSPTLVKKSVNSREDVRAKQQRVKWLENELAERMQDLSNISLRVGKIYAEIGCERESEDLLSCIRDLSGLVMAEERKEHTAGELQLEIDKQSHELNCIERRMAESERKQNRILIRYGALDLQSLQDSVRKWSEAGEKLQTIDHLDRELQPLLTEASRVGMLLDDYSLDVLKSDVQEISEKIGVIDDVIAGLNQDIGGVRQQLEDRTSDRSFDNAALEVNRIGVCVESHMRDWRVLATTNKLFHVLRDEYETSRQPEVLQVASEFMNVFSDGKYQRIWTPVEEPLLYLEDANGEVWTLDVLSRGTREAVFLCIRFALVKHYSSRGLKLPLILDDVLVNCDELRMRGALSVIEQMRDSVSQVFFFTCHKHVRDAFSESEADVRSITPRTDLKAPALKRHWMSESGLAVAGNEEFEADVVIVDVDTEDDTVLIDEFESRDEAA